MRRKMRKIYEIWCLNDSIKLNRICTNIKGYQAAVLKMSNKRQLWCRGWCEIHIAHIALFSTFLWRSVRLSTVTVLIMFSFYGIPLEGVEIGLIFFIARRKKCQKFQRCPIFSIYRVACRIAHGNLIHSFRIHAIERNISLETEIVLISILRHFIWTSKR